MIRSISIPIARLIHNTPTNRQFAITLANSKANNAPIKTFRGYPYSQLLLITISKFPSKVSCHLFLLNLSGSAQSSLTFCSHWFFLQIMSNTFDGVVREFPFVSLDRFNCGTPVSLLTHCHADHLAGLLNKLMGGIVYCSHVTKKLLEADPRYARVIRFVKSVPFNTRTRLELPSLYFQNVYITLIEAYHCVGAAMFLIEETENEMADLESKEKSNVNYSKTSDGSKRDVSVLCTGDIRAEQWWCDSLRRLAFLLPYLSGEKSLANIYFDSTFYKRWEPYIEIPPNNLAIYTAICLLKLYPVDDPEVKFEFPDVTLGFEQVWAFFLSYFKGSLSAVDMKVDKRLQIVAEYDQIHGGIIANAIRIDNIKRYPKFYAGSTNSPYSIRIKEFIDFNIMDFAGVSCPMKLANVPAGEPMELLHITQNGTQFFHFRNRNWILPRNGTELLPQEIKLVFSRHLSYTETVEMIKMFRPMQVFPICYSKETWKSGFSMKRLYGDLCQGEKFLFDEMMKEKYGSPAKFVLERPVTTVNRWSIEQCEQERAFVEKVQEQMDENGKIEFKMEVPALIDLRRVTRVPVFQKRHNQQDPQIFDRNGDFVLQKMVEQRQKQSHKDFIEYQQTLYYQKHNLLQYVPSIGLKRGRQANGRKKLRVSKNTLGGSSDYSSHSSDSSFDLLDARGGACRYTLKSDEKNCSGSEKQDSIAVFSDAKLFYGVDVRRSFVNSSFGSFEESLAIRPSFSY